MGLRTDDVGSESVARMSRSQAAAGLSSVPPSSLPLKGWPFVQWGPAGGSGACLLSILAVLTRYPSGCFHYISRCSPGSCRELSADPAVALPRAPRVCSM